jgi:hypothetical protein
VLEVVDTRSGSVVNLASAAVSGNADRAAYNASKQTGPCIISS